MLSLPLTVQERKDSLENKNIAGLLGGLPSVKVRLTVYGWMNPFLKIGEVIADRQRECTIDSEWDGQKILQSDAAMK